MNRFDAYHEAGHIVAAFGQATGAELTRSGGYCTVSGFLKEGLDGERDALKNQLTSSQSGSSIHELLSARYPSTSIYIDIQVGGVAGASFYLKQPSKWMDIKHFDIGDDRSRNPMAGADDDIENVKRALSYVPSSSAIDELIRIRVSQLELFFDPKVGICTRQLNDLAIYLSDHGTLSEADIKEIWEGRRRSFLGKAFSCLILIALAVLAIWGFFRFVWAS